MILLKNQNHIDLIKVAGRICADTLSHLSLFIKPGMTGLDVDKEADDFIQARGGIAACKGYNGYPASICISVNSGAVHNIPTNKPFLEGDVVKLDLVVDYNDWKADSAITVLIPPVRPEVRKLAEATYLAMLNGLEQAKEGNRVSDISRAIFNASNGKYGVVKEFCGHAIGKNIHEAPRIPNYVTQNNNELLVAGMVLCIEPIFCLGKPEIYIKQDDWNTWTMDGSAVSHFEHTLVVNHAPLPPTILTLRSNENIP